MNLLPYLAGLMVEFVCPKHTFVKEKRQTMNNKQTQWALLFYKIP